MMFLSACGGKNVIDGEEASPEPTGIVEPTQTPIKPTVGGTLKLAMRNPMTLNPLVNNERSVDQVLKLVFEPLFEVDEEYRPVPVLVESYTFEPDYSAITVVLKKDQLFHNENPVTASDVDYSIKELINAPLDAIYKSSINNIQKTTIIDDLTIKIYFKQPYAFSLYHLCFPIVNKSYHQSKEYNDFQPIGSGKYQVTSFISMQQMNLEVAKDIKEEVSISKIECTITRNEEVDELSFEQTLIDMLTPTKFNWLNYSDEPDKRIMEYSTNFIEFLGFNFNNESLQDKNFRQAIAYTINRQDIAKKLFLSHVTITDGLIPPNSYFNPQNELIYSVDSDKAKELMAKVNSSNGLNLRLLVDADNAVRVEMAKLIQENLKEIGVNITIDRVAKPELLEKLKNSDYDLILSGWKLTNAPDYTSLFHSSQIGIGNNFINYNNEFMDYSLKNIATALSDEAKLTNIQEFNTLYTEELPYFSLFFIHSMVTTNENVYGQLNSTADHVLNGIENIYIMR